MIRPTPRRRLAALCTAALTVSLISATASPALAYNGGQAAQYADKWALTPNTAAYPMFVKNDCTNFFSQAARAGGYPFRNAGKSPAGATSWWFASGSGGFSWANAWVAADGYYNFLFADNPGGSSQGSAPGSSTGYWTPDAMVTGDALFFDWGQGSGVSHVTMQVGYGTDPNNPTWKGNYIDEHTSNRYHAFWSLKPYNALYATTTIYFEHINAGN